MLWSQKIIKNHLDTTQTTFSENNNYLRGNISENKKIIPENASFQRYFAELSFDTLEVNQQSYFQNGYFLKKSLVSHRPYNQVKYRLENKNNS